MPLAQEQVFVHCSGLESQLDKILDKVFASYPPLVTSDPFVAVAYAAAKYTVITREAKAHIRSTYRRACYNSNEPLNMEASWALPRAVALAQSLAILEEGKAEDEAFNRAAAQAYDRAAKRAYPKIEAPPASSLPMPSFYKARQGPAAHVPSSSTSPLPSSVPTMRSSDRDIEYYAGPSYYQSPDPSELPMPSLHMERQITAAQAPPAAGGPIPSPPTTSSRNLTPTSAVNTPSSATTAPSLSAREAFEAQPNILALPAIGQRNVLLPGDMEGSSNSRSTSVRTPYSATTAPSLSVREVFEAQPNILAVPAVGQRNVLLPGDMEGFSSWRPTSVRTPSSATTTQSTRLARAAFEAQPNILAAPAVGQANVLHPGDMEAGVFNDEDENENEQEHVHMRGEGLQEEAAVEESEDEGDVEDEESADEDEVYNTVDESSDEEEEEELPSDLSAWNRFQVMADRYDRATRRRLCN